MNEASTLQFSSATDCENLPDCSKENFSKGASQINLITDGSENIEEETDICLGINKAKHKKKVRAFYYYQLGQFCT